MLLTTPLDRIFIFHDKDQEIILSDPEPTWNLQAVLNFYSGTYPILTTAKISAPVIKDDKIQYRFESVMGTKG
ncbi:PRTRC system protein C [Chryseobacterium populi]|uniref:PRTRC system protein C n=1 Tax=Chryseobacterium populi TaxID=1144316 RepID=J3CM35_9FLAO|nr:PRTRC system protein C [Chryseobacterium populi]EJL74404.1 PRTRC system protein C [Chryseobacterium populi]